MATDFVDAETSASERAGILIRSNPVGDLVSITLTQPLSIAHENGVTSLQGDTEEREITSVVGTYRGYVEPGPTSQEAWVRIDPYRRSEPQTEPGVVLVPTWAIEKYALIG